MNPALVISLVISGLALLVGTGLVPMYIRHSNKQAVSNHRLDSMERDMKEHKAALTELAKAGALTTQTVEMIQQRLTKLDVLESVAADVRNLNRLVEHVMPRTETESRFSDVQHRVENVEAVVFNKS
jgi:hypothetical protein